MEAKEMSIDSEFLEIVQDLDLSFEELEGLEAPGWKFWAGAAAGFAVGAGFVGVGIVIGT